MQQLKLTLRGTRPLLQHNVRLVDPLDEWTQKLAKATTVAKTKKSEEAYREMADVEFLGALYHDEEIGPYIKTEAIEKCLKEAAGTGFRGFGKKVERGVLVTGNDGGEIVPLLYRGPRDIDGLLKDHNYRLRAAVGVGQNKVMRTRPRFQQWSLDCMVLLDESQVSKERLLDIAEYGGLYIGLQDYRPRYGRFEVTM
jgi:hypothetical protein